MKSDVNFEYKKLVLMNPPIWENINNIFKICQWLKTHSLIICDISVSSRIFSCLKSVSEITCSPKDSSNSRFNFEQASIAFVWRAWLFQAMVLILSSTSVCISLICVVVFDRTCFTASSSASFSLVFSSVSLLNGKRKVFSKYAVLFWSAFFVGWKKWFS